MEGSTRRGALVSIVVRTKDRPKLFAEALTSIALQTHRPIEAVVVNDGGDDVRSVVDAFAGRLDSLLVDLRPGRGRSAAANAGIAAARGAWVGFLDDDDLLLPDAVAVLLDASGGGDVVPYGRVDAYFHPEGESPRLFRVFSRPFDLDALLFENFIPINACLIPAEILRDVGGMDERLECFEDWDLFLRLSDRLPFRHVDRQVAEYRIFDQAFITGRGGQERQHLGRVAIFSKHAHRYTADALSRMQYAVKTAPAVTDVVTAEIESRLREREAKLAAAVNDLAQVSRRLADAERTLGAIESSRGWRLYQRLRRLLGRR
jgi:glycosyltransferase involved in cell wall biosynthesis